MGLGLHGGGSASARFFAEAGADVTVTDLRSREVLDTSVRELSDLKLRYVLGRHDIEDFRNADIIIKNPAVKPDSPYLEAARSVGAKIETDISTFLRLNRRPLFAVTGSKGKSTTVSALHHVLKKVYPETDLGGNITLSPLTFYSEEKNKSAAPVILELSSWQLADLAGKGLLKAPYAAVTNIMHDHQDRYHSMDDYAADKAVIFESQTESDILLLNAESEYSGSYASAAHSRIYYFRSDCIETEGACLDDSGCGYWIEDGSKTLILNSGNFLKGRHNGLNLLTAAALLFKFGLGADIIRNGLSEFPGIAHRLEYVRDAAGLSWYNDSAATIPEAAAAAVESFDGPLHLITGGTDKELDFSPLATAAQGGKAPASISLLSGTGTEKIIKLFKLHGIGYDGPFDGLQAAVSNIIRHAEQTEGAQAAVLSPGCASFGMFKNEFDRGNQFKALINSL